MKNKKEKSYSKTKKDLDKIFSVFIRKRDGGKCFTCGAQKRWEETDAGHYIKRQHLTTRWDEKNTNCQCRCCNRFRDGNKELYAISLEKKYGYGILQELDKLKNSNKLFKLVDLEKMIKVYKLKVEEMKNGN